MNGLNPSSAGHEVAVEIGGTPILLRSREAEFRALIERRYASFLGSATNPALELDIDAFRPGNEALARDDVRVWQQDEVWRLEGGDFRGEWNARAGRGRIVQAPDNPYAIDSVLRIVHSLIQASEGGFLLHAASAIRRGRAFVLSGVSGAGKTTISRLAPSDATLLTDEISYVRLDGSDYRACGTPFAGELARVGQNVSAPIAQLFFLAQGHENRVERLAPTEALRLLLRNILFFADDAELVEQVFRSACDFLGRVPVSRLTFFPDERVWDLIV
jgi:hypothetical protein